MAVDRTLVQVGDTVSNIFIGATYSYDGVVTQVTEWYDTTTHSSGLKVELAILDSSQASQ